MPRTLQDAVADANRQGLAIHNLFQLPDGSWRACVKVFGATHDLAVNPIYLNYADGDDPAECIDRAISSSGKIRWKEAANVALLAMQGMGEPCIATLDPADRPTIAARKLAHHNKPATADSPAKPKPKATLDEVEAMMRDRAAKSVAGSKRRTLDDKLDSLL